MREKRGTPRTGFRCEVECEEVESGARPPNPRVSDISTSGVYIDTTITFPVGSIVNLRFTLPSLQVRVSADVIHSIPAMGMGMRFRDLTPAQKTAIEEIVDAADLEATA
jgi:hypothetical protein